MAIRGTFTNDAGDDFNYEVVQYKMRGPRIYKARSANFAKLDSRDIDWARIQVTRKDDSREGLYTTLWGPYLSRNTIELELGAAMGTDEYMEAIG